MIKQDKHIRVRTEREFILEMVRTGAVILVVSTLIAVAVTWFTTRHYEAYIHYRALRTATILPVFIVAACIAIIGRQNLRHHRNMLELTRIAHTDEMTGLANRRSFMREAETRLREMRAEGSGLCLLIVDLDHFKAVNDEYGHCAGDTTLEHVATRMQRSMPASALVARLGGEEFAIMVKFEDMNELQERAEILRQSVANAPCQVGAQTIRVTISVGVGIASEDDTVSSLMSRADCALYVAKGDGRNRFSIAA